MGQRSFGALTLVHRRIMHEDYCIRLARRDDIASLPAIEVEAGRTFPSAGIVGDFLEITVPLEVHAAAQAEGLLWVAARGEEPVGFALVDMLDDGLPHLEELAVHPDHGRRGVGRSLVEAVAAWARERGHASLSLSTFREVPWNAPFYETAGFRAVPELTPALQAVVDGGRRRGLPVDKRIVMRRRLD